MTYKFKLKSGEIVSVFYEKLGKDPSKNFYGFMSWRDKSSKAGEYKECISDVHMDDDYRLYFMYGDEKVYFSDFLALTPEQLAEKVNNHECVNPEELVYTLKRYGTGSLLITQPKEKIIGVLIGKTVIGVERRNLMDDILKLNKVDFEFAETDHFKLEDNYKIKLVPHEEESKALYGSDLIYINDLVSLMTNRPDLYKLKINVDFERKRITPEDVTRAVEELGWSEVDARRGYSIFTSDFGNGALHIEKIDAMGVFDTDDEAAIQAERDGIKIIRDMKFSEEHYANYIDTPENRELLKDLAM